MIVVLMFRVSCDGSSFFLLSLSDREEVMEELYTGYEYLKKCCSM
jgi:hypothetical protein